MGWEQAVRQASVGRGGCPCLWSVFLPPLHAVISFQLLSRSSGQCLCQQHLQEVPDLHLEAPRQLGVVPGAVTQPESPPSSPLSLSHRQHCDLPSLTLTSYKN